MSKTGGLTAGLLVLSLLPVDRSDPPARRPKYPEGLYAEVTTNKGLIVLKLEFEKTPMTVANFVGLAEGTIDNAALPPGRPFFDGTKWHRVVPGHVIQCGIAAGGKAEDPGYEFPNEIVLPELNHGRAGMVDMANGGPHTNGSQWYITLGDRSYLDGDYTVFGSVVEGMDVVMSIVQGDEIRTREDRPRRQEGPRVPADDGLVQGDGRGGQGPRRQGRRREEGQGRRARPDELARRDRDRRRAEGTSSRGPAREGRRSKAIRSRPSTRGKAPLTGRTFVSTADQGKPYWGETPEPFEMTVGTACVNPGLDARDRAR